MLTLYHAPYSRSSRIIRLIMELGILDQVDIRIVGVARNDGSGGADPANPHPEGKVPLLVHDGVEIWESNAIILYLTDMFPASGFGRSVGEPDRGSYLGWLAWYGNVVEPVIVLQAAELSHPIFDVTFRGMPEVVARLMAQLQKTPFLLGDAFSAADLLLVSPFVWAPQATPDAQIIRDWVARCQALPSAQAAAGCPAGLSPPPPRIGLPFGPVSPHATHSALYKGVGALKMRANTFERPGRETT